jgi:HK97 gp10 family phage protein
LANSITFKVEGLSELARRIATLKSDVALKMAPRATGKAASLVKKAAKAKLRANPTIDTGLLEKNVIVKKVRNSEFTAEHIVTVKKRLYPKRGKEKEVRNTRQVGSYKEFGTVNNPAEPYLRPALSGNVNKAISVIVNSLKADLDKVGARLLESHGRRCEQSSAIDAISAPSRSRQRFQCGRQSEFRS